jgi:hypothetical protein
VKTCTDFGVLVIEAVALRVAVFLFAVKAVESLLNKPFHAL